MSKKRLGRGLDALLSGESLNPSRAVPSAELSELPIDQIYRSPHQPRRDFNEEALEELAQSIRSQGVMQPIVVRPRLSGGYELIAGERRWRAAQLAGLTGIPAVLREVDDEQASAMALIENIQREDLNPMEQAHALQRLRDEFSLTHEQIANAVGKSRVAVTNLMRLLNLAPGVRALVDAGEIEMGHARALLTLETADQERLAQDVARRGLSVRQTEQLVRSFLGKSTRGAEDSAGPPRKDPDTQRLESDLSDKIGAPVQINYNAKGKGQLVIRYSNIDQLEGILEHIH